MKYTTPEISWHGRDPIYSVDFQYLKGKVERLATCGTDQQVRIWEVVSGKDGRPGVEFLSSLTRHTRTVNVVRFSPDGQVLASGGDDSVVMLWRLNPMPAGGLFQEEEQENKENWSVFKVLRSHLEDVYDLCWSSCGKFMISGSVDNSAILWNVKKGVRLGIFPDHKSFVQGVAFDPQSEYLATMSSDRSLRIYSYETKNCLHTVSKVSFAGINNNTEEEKSTKEKSFKMFHDDTMKSFFRRLCFSPDGNFLIVPAGCIEKGPGEEADHTTYIFSRNNFSQPILHLPGPNKATLAARACPVLFELRKIPRRKSTGNKPAGTSDGEDSTNKMDSSDSSNSSDGLKDWQKYETMFCLPHRVVFAIATEDAVLLYDTQQPQPFAYIANIHYHTISDISWSHNAKYLVVSSTDGFCTIISFDDGELGTPIKDQPVHVYSQAEFDAKELEKKKEKEAKELAKKNKDKEVDKQSVPSNVPKVVPTTAESNTEQKTEIEKIQKVTSTKENVSNINANPVVVSSSTEENPVPASPVPNKNSASIPSSASGVSPVVKKDSAPTKRRVQLTTLIRSPSSSASNTAKTTNTQRQAESSLVTTPVKKVDAAANNTDGQTVTETVKEDSKKAPRRIGITTLSVYKEPEGSEGASAGDAPDRNEDSLHLVLEN